MDLFDHSATKKGPLADRMRPERFSELAGQPHLFGPDKLLARLIRADRVPSLILWGPPGTGKTTTAEVIARETSATFEPFSAVLGGVADLRKILGAARERARVYGKRTILFVDEIHRFNKGQQDALLPHVEDGTVTLIGATTENPSFAVNAALLSRARVFRLEPLGVADLEQLLGRALRDSRRGLGELNLEAEDGALRAIAEQAHGDARRALSVLEVCADLAHASGGKLRVDDVQQALSSKTLLYDKSGEEHYNVVSAFIKSMRGNDPDAAVYWLMRMLEAGEDPRFVLRRMLIFASEDIGNADPRALELVVAADQAFARLGMPEGMFAIAQCCTYLASAPKSNASYEAWTSAQADVRERGALPVPLKLRNAATAAMKEWGYGDGYRYPHAEGGHAAGESYLPDELVGKRYYRPRPEGLESRIASRLARLRGEVSAGGAGAPSDDEGQG